MKNVIILLLLSVFYSPLNAQVVKYEKEENLLKINLSKKKKYKVDKKTFIDERDGNEYKFVKIGKQFWFAENLRYSGDIPEVVSNEEWNSFLKEDGSYYGYPAWSYYENDPKNDSIYGKLYNWAALRDEGLCPPGWHIPTYMDWDQLRDYLKGPSVAGKAVTSISGWDPDSDSRATNKTGFTALPSGRRDLTGNYKELGKAGYWWISLKGIGQTNVFMVNYKKLDFSENIVSTNSGISCRCIKD